MTWIEHVASPLPRECSTTELHGLRKQLVPDFGAGEGNRTLVISLEGFCSTIELHPHTTLIPLHATTLDTKPGEIWWREKDSNLRRLSRQIYSLIPLATREPLHRKWCRHQESNSGPTDYKSVALPTELCRRVISGTDIR